MGDREAILAGIGEYYTTPYEPVTALRWDMVFERLDVQQKQIDDLQRRLAEQDRYVVWLERRIYELERAGANAGTWVPADGRIWNGIDLVPEPPPPPPPVSDDPFKLPD